MRLHYQLTTPYLRLCISHFVFSFSFSIFYFSFYKPTNIFCNKIEIKLASKIERSAKFIVKETTMENKEQNSQQQETQDPVTLNVTEVPSAPKSPEVFPIFKKVRKSLSPLPRIDVSSLALASLAAGIACVSPSIPDETMNMVYSGGAAACVMASSSSSSPSRSSAVVRVPRNAARGGNIAYDDESSDDESVIDVDEDSNPSLKERKPVNYDQEQKDNMEDETTIFKSQLRLMKRSSRYTSYENQTSVAVNICNLFFDVKSVVIQMVIGYTQSGKTGCMVELIDQMTKNTCNPISTQNIFIITGLSSRDWMKQTKGRIPECMRERVFHNGQLEKFKAAVAGKQNVLVIVDEAHMASKKKQTMSRIFKELNWKLDYMMENDIKLVQFSATPDGLIFALSGPKWPEEHYRITTMKPGSGYFGAKQMNERKQLKQIKDIYGRDKDGKWIDDEVRKECLENIVEILHDQLKFSGPRYLVVRIRGGIPEQRYHENFFEAIESLPTQDQEKFEEHHRHRHYNMRGNVEDISELLYKTPTKHTIVFIKEKMKCAQTLEYVVLDEKTGKTTTHKVKHNIGVVVERKRSGDKDEQNDSFTIQGLLGRLCGYEEHDCICYTNLASFEKYEKLFASNFDTKTLKRVSWNSNTTHGKGEGKGTSVHPTVNDECIESDTTTTTTSVKEEEEVDISLYRIYDNESVVRDVCNILGYRYVPTENNDAGFKETSLNTTKGVASLLNAVRKVPTAYGGGKGYRVYYPCYVDTTNSATLRFVVIIRPNIDESKIAECDSKFTSLSLREASLIE